MAAYAKTQSLILGPLKSHKLHICLSICTKLSAIMTHKWHWKYGRNPPKLPCGTPYPLSPNFQPPDHSSLISSSKHHDLFCLPSLSTQSTMNSPGWSPFRLWSLVTPLLSNVGTAWTMCLIFDYPNEEANSVTTIITNTFTTVPSGPVLILRNILSNNQFLIDDTHWFVLVQDTGEEMALGIWCSR